MAYSFDERIVSDLHKDARGCRPSQFWWEIWNESTDDRKQTIWDSLIVELNDEIERERQAENAALIALHQRIQGTMLIGAKDEVQALKWIMEAEQFDDYDLRYGPSYFCYHFGLNYSVANELPIQEAINEMLSEVV